MKRRRAAAPHAKARFELARERAAADEDLGRVRRMRRRLHSRRSFDYRQKLRADEVQRALERQRRENDSVTSRSQLFALLKQAMKDWLRSHRTWFTPPSAPGTQTKSGKQPERAKTKRRGAG